MFSHQGPVLSVCWNKVRFGVSMPGRWFTKLHRREAVSFQQEPTTLAECTMFRRANPLKSQNTMLPSASSSMSIPLVVVSWLPEAGIRPLRFETIAHPITRAQLAVQYWDIRSQNPVSSVTLPERCYSLDVSYPLMVVGTAERHIQIFNLTSPTAPYKVRLEAWRTPWTY